MAITISARDRRDLNTIFKLMAAALGYQWAAFESGEGLGDVVADGGDALAKLASTSDDRGAELVAIRDAGGKLTATNVEDALAELADMIQAGVSQALLAMEAATEKTIAAGAITATQSYHKIDTEADGASDDLDTINGLADGQMAIFRLENAGRNVVFKHGAGNIVCPFGEDVTLDAADDLVVAFRNGSKAMIFGMTLAAADGGGLGKRLASTANAKGASTVGVEDAATLLAAANVEAALTEIVKKANAALGSPVCVPVILSKHSNGSIAARFTPGFAGKLRKITASVVDPATTADKGATFTPAVGGAAVTGGALALTSANTATLGAKVDGSAITAGNAFTAADEITIVASSVTAFVEGQVLIYLFLDPA